MFEVAAKTGEVRELWRATDLRDSYSPAVHHRDAIFGMGGGRLMCLDSADGRTLWAQAIGSGSLVRVDDYLVVFASRSGRLHLVEASRDGYKEVAPPLRVFPSGDHSLTSPSFGAGRVFLRGKSEIAAVRIAY